MLDETKKKQKLDLFVISEALICAVIVYGMVTIQSNIASLFFKLSFIILLCKFIRHLFAEKDFKKSDKLMMTIVFISAANVILNSLLKDHAINFQHLTSYFIFASTIILFNFSDSIKLNQRTCDFIFLIQIAVSLIYIYVYNFIPRGQALSSQGLLTFNFSNSNLAGMFLLQSLLFMSIGIIYFEKKILKILCVALTVVLYKYTLETGTRSALIAYFLFLLLCLLYLFKENFKLPKWLLLTLNAAPIIFVPVYLKFIDIVEASGKLYFLISEGKNLDSRVEIWNRFITKFDNSWFLGNYANCLGNSHNSLLVVLVSYGLIVLILTIIFNYYVSQQINSRITNRFQGICLSAYLAVVFMGFGEGALYSGGIGLYIFPALFIMLANSDLKAITKLNIKDGEKN